MIVQNSESLHDNPTNPPATTRQPSGLTPGTALACASGLPVAGIDLAATDRGVAAADAAASINPNGSSKGRAALADALTAERPECKSWNPTIRLAVLQRLAIIKNDLQTVIDREQAEMRRALPGSARRAQAETRCYTPSDLLREIHRNIRDGEDLRGLWWFAWGAGIDFAGGALGESERILREWLKADSPLVVNNGRGDGDLCPNCGRKWQQKEPSDDGVPDDSPFGGARKIEPDGNWCPACGHYENWHRRDTTNTLVDLTA